MKYRKKPVVVEAIHYRGKQDDSLLKSFVGSLYLYRDGETYKWRITTPEGDHQISDGDYIIKGVKGEFYPCKPDIFEMTYESAECGCCQKGKDHIALTVEEAEILTRCAANEFCRLILEHAPVDLARQVEVLMYDLVKRIKQAEKCDGKTL